MGNQIKRSVETHNITEEVPERRWVLSADG